MKPSEIIEAYRHIATLADLRRAVFGNEPYGNAKTVIQFPFGGANKMTLDDAEQAVVLRALYDNAVAGLDALGVDYSEGI